MTGHIQVRTGPPSGGNEAVMLLRAILEKQNEQNALLNTMVKRQSQQVRQTSEWQKQFPDLAKRCHGAAQRASELLNGLLERLVTDLEQLETDGYESDYALMELVDKYGYKFQQLSMMLQTLAQLGKE